MKEFWIKRTKGNGTSCKTLPATKLPVKVGWCYGARYIPTWFLI